MQKTLIALLVLVCAAGSVLAAGNTPPVVKQDFIPGFDTIAYDDGSRYQKVCYTASGIGKGWGVRYYLPTNSCAYFYEAQINLCPPELDGPYVAEAVIYAADGPGGAPGTVLGRRDYDVRVGEWWHYVYMRDLDIVVEAPGFYVFSYPKTYPQYMYQWFDRYDDAPGGSQWYYNGTTFAPYTSVNFGDIGIRAIIEAHDVQTVAIQAPLGIVYGGQTITPKAYIRNGTDLWTEEDVSVRYWIYPMGGGAPVYDQTLTIDFPANNTPWIQSFPSVQVDWPTGDYFVACSTGLDVDYSRWNDKALNTVRVENLDAGMNGVKYPRGYVAQGVTIAPEATVVNYGTVTASFSVSFQIKDAGNNVVYTNNQFVTGLPAGDNTHLTFVDWVVGAPGVYTATCRTMLVGDNNPANDIDDEVFTSVATLVDAAATEVTSPTGTVKRTKKYPLKATIVNNGTGSATFTARCRLTRPDSYVFNYSKSVTLAPGESQDVQFKNRKYAKVGEWNVVVWTELAGDQNDWNDQVTSSFVSAANPGWSITEDLSTGPAVNKGAAIVSAGDETFYLLRGSKANDIYKLGEEVDEAEVVATVPAEGRKTGYGTSMALIGNTLYLLKGNKSEEFYGLDLTTNEWLRLADIPAGASDKLPRKGAALTVAGDKVYLVKGNKTDEFYCYDPAVNEWTVLAPMPAGPQQREPLGGAALCASGNRLFALKGNKTTEFYTYDIPSGAWQQLADIPTDRIKDGACLAVLDGVIFATVGGNKMEFHAYDRLTNTWTRLEDVPREPDSRKVKYGAAMAALDGNLLFLKGRKTEVLFAYEPDVNLFGAKGEPQGGVEARPIAARPEFSLAPNPTTGMVRIQCAAGFEGAVAGRLVNSVGRTVQEFSSAQGGVMLDVSGLANGVYLVVLNSDSASASQRLVIQH